MSDFKERLKTAILSILRELGPCTSRDIYSALDEACTHLAIKVCAWELMENGQIEMTADSLIGIRPH